MVPKIWMVMNIRPTLSHSDWEEKWGTTSSCHLYCQKRLTQDLVQWGWGQRNTTLPYLIFPSFPDLFVPALSPQRLFCCDHLLRCQRPSLNTSEKPQHQTVWGFISYEKKSHLMKSPSAWMPVWNSRIIKPCLHRTLDEPHRNSTLTIFSV